MSAQSTLAGNAAAETVWDVVVIGAGPAGSMAARQLARRGARVLLVERKAFPRAKVCGACLNQRAVSWLEIAGLGEMLSRLRAIPTRRFRAYCGGRSLEIALPGGVSVSRDALDGALMQAAVDAGAELMTGITATLRESPRHAGDREIDLRDSAGKLGAIRAKIVLAADGLGRPALRHTGEFVSRVSRGAKIGVRAGMVASCDRFQPGTIYMAVGRSGYAGLVRVEDGSLNLAAALAPRMLRRAGSPQAAVAALFDEAGMGELAMPAGGCWGGTPPLTQRALRPAGKRVLLLGDSAGYIEPFTGEGIAWALESGMAIAPIAERGLHEWSGEVEQAWLDLHRRLVRNRQRWCRAFAAVLQRPRIARMAVQLAAAWPRLCRPVVRGLNRPLAAWEICQE